MTIKIWYYKYLQIKTKNNVFFSSCRYFKLFIQGANIFQLHFIYLLILYFWGSIIAIEVDLSNFIILIMSKHCITKF